MGVLYWDTRLVKEEFGDGRVGVGTNEEDVCDPFLPKISSM